MEEEKEVLRKRWHQEVDTIFDKLGSSISLMEDNSLESIKTQQKNNQGYYTGHGSNCST